MQKLAGVGITVNWPIIRNSHTRSFQVLLGVEIADYPVSQNREKSIFSRIFSRIFRGFENQGKAAEFIFWLLTGVDIADPAFAAIFDRND